MNFLEYDAAMLPLKNRFKNQYNGDVLVSIFDTVKNLNVDDFKKVVPYLNGRVRTVPMVQEFEKAMLELNVRPRLALYQPGESHVQTVEDFTYCIRENIWADNTYIFMRGPRPSFIVKKDHPTHPLVIEDNEVRTLRIKEVKQHLAQNTYTKFMESKNEGLNGMRRAFSKEGA